MDQFEKALDKCSLMINNMPENYLSSAWVLRGLLNELLGNEKEAKNDFKNAKSQDEKSKNFLEKNEPITLEIFPDMNRLCIQFPLIEFKFANHSPIVPFIKTNR